MTRFLIVDDNEQNLYMLQVLLTGHGYDVESATDGAKALEAARHNPPDLIIADILMPVMDGFALCREWKNDTQLQHIPFVFYTATYTDPKDEKFALSLGAERFILKPAEPGVFIGILREVLENHEAGRQAAPRELAQEEEVFFKEYNQALVRKLEDKMMQLEETNRALEHDITERKRLEGQLRQAQKMEALGRLAGGIAHDFNNLLTIIRMSCQMLERQLHPMDPAWENVQQIQDAGERATTLTRQLLSFSRQEAVKPQVLDLNLVVDNLGQMLQRIIGKDIRLATVLEDGLWPVHMDPTQVDQMIMNLAVNARDAMPQGGILTIETANVVLDEEYATSHVGARPGEHVMLSVTDTGMGMNDEVKARLFEPFFTTKEKGKGTGLGLAIVYGIVNQNEGHIGIYSEVGQGATFRVYLPAFQVSQ